MDRLTLLRDLERGIEDGFKASRHIMAFDTFFGLVCANPRRHLRTAAQYLRDCLLHYGTYTVDRPGGPATRYRLFDCPWQDGRDRVIGQEDAQQALFRTLQGFVRERRTTRLVLLHGPNGSAKSSFVDCLARGMEHYATLDEGAIYRFNWVFPKSHVAKKRLGFGSAEAAPALHSFANLDDDDVDARLPGDLRDHPLLLLPIARRQAIIDQLRTDGELDEAVGTHLLTGDLSPRSRAIADALLSAYKGDFQRVLQHIQVERFVFSRRYRKGLVTIEPQLHVDASMRQVTMDQGLQALPTTLRSLSLFEPAGDLVDANRGLINYNDLLKKPVDGFKYLLATCERGTVALPQAILHLDVVFVASSNEIHLKAFKAYPDWASFKGRMDLVKMPYLRDYAVEQAIYDAQIEASGLAPHVVPHATSVLAEWAVLTRLHRADPDGYPTPIREVIGRLTPYEKADLYAGRRLPKELTPEQARELRAALPNLLAEGQETPLYEGSIGASPREMKQVMLNALQDPRHHGISALGILAELGDLIRHRTVYDYLQLDPDAGYHDYPSFITQVRDRYFERVDGELRSAMGLIAAKQYDELFARYILHVSYLFKGESLYNDATGRFEDPDAQLMDRLEAVWEVGTDPTRFRRDLVARVGAWRVENEGAPIDYRLLFPKLIAALETDYYRQQRTRVERQARELLTVLIAAQIGEDPTHHGLSEAEAGRAEAVRLRLEEEFGYAPQPLREVLTALLKAHY